MQINSLSLWGKRRHPKGGFKLPRRINFIENSRDDSASSQLYPYAVSWLIECTIRSRQSLRQMMINGATSPGKRARSSNRPRNLVLFGSIPAFGTAMRFIRRASIEVKSLSHRLQIYMAILFSRRNSIHRSFLVPLVISRSFYVITL